MSSFCKLVYSNNFSRNKKTGESLAEPGRQFVVDFFKKNTLAYTGALFLVGHTRDFSNCIFSDIQILCDRLNELGIESAAGAR
jgi:hypothetical protein